MNMIQINMIFFDFIYSILKIGVNDLVANKYPLAGLMKVKTPDSLINPESTFSDFTFIEWVYFIPTKN